MLVLLRCRLGLLWRQRGGKAWGLLENPLRRSETIQVRARLARGTADSAEAEWTVCSFCHNIIMALLDLP